MRKEHSDAACRPAAEFDAIVVGAGFAGLCMLYRLRNLGLSVRLFEAGSGVGGTWFWNRYPGARCDIESVYYSYSFAPELEQEWCWTERYAAQPEILRYLDYVADKFDLRRDILLNTRIAKAHYDEASNRWRIESEAGECYWARYCIMATGSLSAPKAPDFAGLERFRGTWYQTSRWPDEDVDFRGKRVGVIGTGATGIQLIPVIAEQTVHLYVFQRTPNFSVPARNRPLDPEYVRNLKSQYRELRAQSRDSFFGLPTHRPTKSALEASPHEREQHLSRAWQHGGGAGFLGSYTDVLTNREANETVAQFVRSRIREIIKNPVVADRLAPKDHPIGAKRLSLDTNYFSTYNRANVTLVDVRSSLIQEITRKGVRTSDAEYELDLLIFAIGFDAMTGALSNLDVRGRGGKSLKTTWAEGPRTYLGIAIAGFPNFFVMTGPGSPSVLSNMVLASEQHAEWIADCISHLRQYDLESIEATPEAQEAWVAHVNEIADRTLYPLANSWYVGANVPGKLRVFMPYIGGFNVYRKKCTEVAQQGYEGFVLSSTMP